MATPISFLTMMIDYGRAQKLSIRHPHGEMTGQEIQIHFNLTKIYFQVQKMVFMS